jgi:hypothetical protein
VSGARSFFDSDLFFVFFSCVFLRDPKFMLHAAFKALSQEAPTVRAAFAAGSDVALQVQ